MGPGIEGLRFILNVPDGTAETPVLVHCSHPSRPWPCSEHSTFDFETLAANCSAVTFTPTTYWYELSRGLKVGCFLKSNLMMTILPKCWNLVLKSTCKAVHIFCAIQATQNSIFTLQSISIAMPNFNHPAKDSFVIS